jgi:hypothetical protein
VKSASWAITTTAFSLSGGTQPSIEERNLSRTQENTRMYGQQTIKKGMHRLQARSLADLFRHDATSWIDLVHHLSSRTCGPISGCPAVVMVQPTHYWKSDHLVTCILSGRNRSALYRDLLPNPLMGPCQVARRPHTHSERGSCCFSCKINRWVEAFLSYISQKTLTDGIGLGSMNRRFEQLNATGRRNSADTGSILTVVITDQILGCLPIRCRFPERYAPPRHRSTSGSRRHGSLSVTAVL